VGAGEEVGEGGGGVMYIDLFWARFRGPADETRRGISDSVHADADACWRARALPIAIIIHEVN